VIASSTVFRFKGQHYDPQAIGRDLKVQAVLTGKVTTRGERLLVQTDLTSVADGYEIWGEQYGRTMPDIIALQGDIAREISTKLRLKLSGEEERRLTKSDTENIEAYQLYLKGRQYSLTWTRDGFFKGLDYFHQAIEKDPGYALAYDGLAFTYWLSSEFLLPPKEAMPKAKEAAKKALELNESLAEAHTSLGAALLFFDWDWEGTGTEFRRAIELNPRYASAHSMYSGYLILMGRVEEGVREGELAPGLDPPDFELNTGLGVGLWMARRYDQAVQQLRKTLEIAPDYWYARMWLGTAYGAQGQWPEAIAEFNRVRQIEDSFPEILGRLGYVYARAGKKAEALKLLAELEQRSKRVYVPPYLRALIYAGLEEKEQTLYWLEKAFQERSGYLVWIRVQKEFDGLRSDPRFQEFVRRMKFPS
jgi:tetratricopeptide (TPR) repeat protein